MCYICKIHISRAISECPRNCPVVWDHLEKDNDKVASEEGIAIIKAVKGMSNADCRAHLVKFYPPPN
jgi:hypothetical protein